MMATTPQYTHNRPASEPPIVPNRQKKVMHWIKSFFFVALIIAASVGSTLFLSSKAHLFGAAAQAEDANREASAPAQKAPLPGPIFLPLEPFTVTLSNEQRTRILYVAITLRVADDASRALLNSFMPEVRDRVLLELSSQDPVQVQAPEHREQLALGLVKVLEAPYSPQPTGPKISNVLFTAFVVQ